VFISRFLPVLHSLIPLTVGMSTMRYRKFMAWTVPACVIWAFAYVTVGSGPPADTVNSAVTCTGPATSSSR
jgi:membrane protein DedA with SNARE-associated domain